LFRGRHVFMGYMKDTKATSETIDSEGWLHSGDIGRTDNGFLSITGRIKELIITAGGENVPPVLIEDEIKKELGQVISNVMLIGDRKKFLSCLFTLKAKPCKFTILDYFY
jgi:long-chain-fatty-acid--CoA ligase ACSBG